MSLADLAKKMDISPQAINLWELQKKPIPKDRIKELAKIFGLDERYFVPDLPAELEVNVWIRCLFRAMTKAQREEMVKVYTEGETTAHE